VAAVASRAVTTLRTATDPAATADGDALLVGIARGADGPVLLRGAEDVDAALGGRLAGTLTALGATGAAGEVTKLATLGATAAGVLAVVGVGTVAGDYPDEALRRAAGAGVRALAGSARVATTLALANGAPPSEPAVRAVAEGALLAAYRFDAYRSDGHTPDGTVLRPPVELVTLLGVDDAAPTLARAEVVADAVALVRDLVNTPPGDLPPAAVAARARELAAEHGLEVEVLDADALAAGGYGGILGVGAGSASPPRLVRVHHSGGSAAAPAVALVGKGITFDSGGLSLKTAQGMLTMKCDMAGAATVLAAVVAAARLELPVAVTAWLPLAENMPSGTAIRPSDVLHLYGGTTVEVTNTDAEGRLVLADALARAAEESPALMVDVATLTGAQVVALGTRVAAVMGTDAGRDRVVAAAGNSGESLWPMPLPPELRTNLDSEIADLVNSGDRQGGMLTAGLFLQEFVPEGVAWAHLDIAGPAFNAGPAWGYTPVGGTGYGVRTLVDLLADVADHGA